jgi:hypothetical protein
MDIKDAASLITAAIALYGLGAWREQTAAKRQIELAEDALACFYEARDALTHIRSPFSWSNEEDAGERRQGETDGQYEARNRASVAFYRFKTYEDLFSKIHAMRYRFGAAFGEPAMAPYSELRQLMQTVLLSARRLGEMWGERDFDHDESAQRERHWESVRKHEAIFWQQADDDEICVAMNKIISDIEAICRPVLASPGPLSRLRRAALRLLNDPRVPG